MTTTTTVIMYGVVSSVRDTSTSFDSMHRRANDVIHFGEYQPKSPPKGLFEAPIRTANTYTAHNRDVLAIDKIGKQR